jgi:hypothetical protein
MAKASLHPLGGAKERPGSNRRIENLIAPT